MMLKTNMNRYIFVQSMHNEYYIRLPIRNQESYA